MKTAEWSKAFNMRLLGLARLRFDAYCFALWEATGRSTKLSYQEGFRALVMYPERFAAITPVVHVCSASSCKGKTYGSPWCWTHGERFTTPAPTDPDTLEIVPT